MKRLCTKLQLHKSDVSIGLDIHLYDDGSIILEDYEKKDYYVFDSIGDCHRFINNNYVFDL